jgi:hypothetical protein
MEIQTTGYIEKLYVYKLFPAFGSHATPMQLVIISSLTQRSFLDSVSITLIDIS